jgi:hypothetical protein
MNLKKILSLSLGLVVLATVAVLTGTGTVGASPHISSLIAAPPPPSIPVSVTNIPLPVNANITNASVPVTGTVAVSSLPAVQLSGTPAVSVSNTATTPIYVDTDRPARYAFDASCGTPQIDPVSGQANCVLYTVPEGHTAVIESVACSATASAGKGVGSAVLTIPFNSGPTIYFPLALTNQTNNTTGQGLEDWVVTSQVRVYANAPSTGTSNIGLFFDVNGASLSTPTALLQAVTCTITGYVVQP